jgi:hypothetical protein
MASRINWNQHIEAWQASGLSQAAYCRLQGLGMSSFSARLSEHRASAPPPPAPPAPPALVPVKIEPAQPAAAGPLVLRTASGHCLELPASAEPRWVAELLRCLG